MWYLKSAFETYQTVQSAVQNRLGEVQSAILSPVEMMKKFLAVPGQPKAEPETELVRLRRRVTELEARLEKPAPAQKKRNPKAN